MLTELFDSVVVGYIAYAIMFVVIIAGIKVLFSVIRELIFTESELRRTEELDQFEGMM